MKTITTWPTSLIFVVTLLGIAVVAAEENFANEYIPFEEHIQLKVKSKEPHTYLTEDDLPDSWDWRNVNGSNFGSKVLNQKNPATCGSCWAQASTGALSDRYKIATNGLLEVQLAPQNLLNFNRRISGGTCEGGDHIKAYDFISKYGISDDNCMPYAGFNWRHGFVVAALTEETDVQAHQCHTCSWDGNCGFIPRDSYELYGADEFGVVRGEFQMKAEIYARGPIACTINSHATQFRHYQGGIIHCPKGLEECRGILTHLVVIAGWGIDKSTGEKYWIGRNSYGSQWGEGAAGGWFRLARGENTLQIESGICSWATPAKADVDRAIQQYRNSL